MTLQSKTIFSSTFFFFLFFGVVVSQSSAQTKQKKGTLTVNITFSGIEDGYDYKSKTKVFVDGKKRGESPVTLESQVEPLKVIVPTGHHHVKIMTYSWYDGRASGFRVIFSNWEEHTKKNHYSVDGFYEGKVRLGLESKCTLVFDIEAEETTAVWD